MFHPQEVDLELFKMIFALVLRSKNIIKVDVSFDGFYFNRLKNSQTLNNRTRFVKTSGGDNLPEEYILLFTDKPY